MSLLDSVEAMLGGQGGGAAGLADQFNAGGLGHLVQSWAGSGENQSISADQIKSVLGDEHIAAVANRLGISPDDASAKIAEFLPMVMSGISKEGQLPGAGTDLTSIAGGLLKGFLAKGA
jgi:uncharacterized protein YidB (DUF937 family)